MGKLDILLCNFHQKIDDLKAAIIKELGNTNAVLDEEYQMHPEHPMRKVEIMLAEYKGLTKLNGRFARVIGSKIEISGMFSAAGRVAISKVVREFVKTYHVDIQKAIKVFNKGYTKVAITHPEVTDTAVRESIYWYLQPFLEIYDIEEKIQL